MRAVASCYRSSITHPPVLQLLHSNKVGGRIQTSQEIAGFRPTREHKYLMSPTQLDKLPRHCLASLWIEMIEDVVNDEWKTGTALR